MQNSIKNNDKGFSLVELVVAIAILGIIVSPLFASFLISAETANRSRQLGDATQIAENMLEQVQAATAEEIQANSNGMFGAVTQMRTAGGGYEIVDGTKPALDNEYIYQMDHVTSGVSEFDVILKLEANSAANSNSQIEAANKVEVSQYAAMDLVYEQSQADALNPDIEAVAGILDDINSATSGTGTLASLERTIVLQMTTDDSQAEIDAGTADVIFTVLYQYTADYTYTTPNADGTAGTTIETGTVKYGVAVPPALTPIPVFTDIHSSDYKEKGFFVYLFYYPMYDNYSPVLAFTPYATEIITIENFQKLNCDVVLVKQKNAQTTEIDENRYECRVELKESAKILAPANPSTNEPTNVYTNVNTNLMDGTLSKSDFELRLYTGNWQTAVSRPNVLLGKEAETRVYDVTVEVYESDGVSGSLGKQVAEFTAKKVD